MPRNLFPKAAADPDVDSVVLLVSHHHASLDQCVDDPTELLGVGVLCYLAEQIAMRHPRMVREYAANHIHDSAAGIIRTDTIKGAGQILLEALHEIYGSVDVLVEYDPIATHLGSTQTH